MKFAVLNEVLIGLACFESLGWCSYALCVVCCVVLCVVCCVVLYCVVLCCVALRHS